MMNLSQFFEKIIYRDILSYILPGLFQLSGLCIIFLFLKGEENYYEIIKREFQTLNYLIVLGAAFLTGYVISTIFFYINTFINKLQKSENRAISKRILEDIERKYGPEILAVDKLKTLRYIARLQNPELNSERIERKLTLQNLELSIAGIAFIWSFVFIIIFPGLFGIMLSSFTFIFCILVFVSARKLGQYIYEDIQILYRLSIGPKSRPSAANQHLRELVQEKG